MPQAGMDSTYFDESPLGGVVAASTHFWPTGRIEVDFSKDGFGDAGDDVSADAHYRDYVISCERGVAQMRALSAVEAGQGYAVLNNNAGTYDPGSSLVRGLPFRWTAHYLGLDYKMHTGTLQTPVVHGDSLEEVVELHSLGALSQLVGVRISTALYTGITTDVAIGHILDAAGFSATDRDLDTGQTTLTWWWVDPQETADAFDALMEVVTAEGIGAAIYEAGDGTIRFRNRYHLLYDARSSAIHKIYRDLGVFPRHSKPAQGEFLEDSIQNVVNEASMIHRVRTAKSLDVLWPGETPLSFASGEVKKYTIRHVDGHPFTAAVAPVLDTDYTVTAGGITSAVLDRTSGAEATLTITAATGGATITGLQVRAQIVTVDSETIVTNTIDASVSITANGQQTKPRATRSEISLDDAQNSMNGIVAWYQNGRKTLRFMAENMDDRNTVALLDADLGDKIRVIASLRGIDDQAYVKNLRTSLRGASIRTEIEAEEAWTTEWAIWDTAIWDTSWWVW